MADHNTTDAVSRRNVLKTAGGLLAGSTMLAGLGAETGAAAAEEGLQFEIEEANEEVIIARVSLSDEIRKDIEPAGRLFVPTGGTFLGHRNQFIVEEDTVSLPEDTDGLANPTRQRKIAGGPLVSPITVEMHFPTQDIDFSGAEVEDGMITMGVAIVDTPGEVYGFDRVRFDPPKNGPKE